LYSKVFFKKNVSDDKSFVQNTMKSRYEYKRRKKTKNPQSKLELDSLLEIFDVYKSVET
jgi:hypothetical protein